MYILRGDLEITVEGEKYRLKPGEQLLLRERDAAQLEDIRDARKH